MAKNEVKNDIYRSYKKNVGTYLSMSISCFVVFLLVMVINFFLFGSILITFPFVVVPFFIGMVISTVKIESGDEWSSKEFYQYCRVGFHRQFRRSLRVFNSFCKAFLRFLFYSAIAVLIVLIFRDSLLDPVLSEIVSKNSLDRNLTNAVMDYLHDFNNQYVLIYLSLFCFAFVLSFVYFMECLSDNTMMLFLTLNVAMPHNQMVTIHNQIKKAIKKEYKRIYYSLTWPVTIIFTAGFALGAFIAMTNFQNIQLIFLLGMLIGLLFTIPYYPIAILVIHRLFNMYADLYYSESKEAVEKNLQKIMDNPRFSDKQKEIIKELLDKQSLDAFGRKIPFNNIHDEAAVFIEEIKKIYLLDGEVQSVQKIERGIINDTYLAIINNKKFILQKINKNVFNNMDSLLNNAYQVSEFICERVRQDSFGKRACLQIIKNKNGGLFVELEGKYFRFLTYIDNSIAYESTSDLEIVQEAGRVIGKFQKDMQGFDITKIKETIPDFHNTPKRFRHLQQTATEDIHNRLASVEKEISYLSSMQSYFAIITDGLYTGATKTCVIHGDTKLSNILFNEHTNKGLCLIDYDTLMLGSILYDFGDAARSLTNIASPQTKRALKAEFSPESFAAFATGFLDETSTFLTEFEINNLFNATLIIALELAIRYLDDYLAGDNYFKIDYSQHNYDRALRQIDFCRQLVEKRELVEELLQGIIKKFNK